MYKDSEPERAQQRVVQVVELGGKEKAELLVLCTNFDYRQKSVERHKSMVFINKLVKEHDDTPAILGGTLNSGPTHIVYKELAKEWKIPGVDPTGMRLDAFGEEGKKKYSDLRTWPANEPRYRVNTVACRPADGWMVVDLQVLPEAVASEHRPMLVVLRRVEKSKIEDVRSKM